jgi:predicted NUDIX family NTP pyrophosphohydrolase
MRRDAADLKAAYRLRRVCRRRANRKAALEQTVRRRVFLLLDFVSEGAAMDHQRRQRGTKPHISAGLLAFRRRPELEVLLAHPGGPFWAKKDDGSWTIPKGLVEAGADLLANAQREFTEETNLAASGAFMPLAPVKQKSGKLVRAWAFEADLDTAAFASNLFEMEWPPRSGRRQSFAEIDRIAYFSLPIAMIKILAYQQPLLAELQARIAAGG